MDYQISEKEQQPPSLTSMPMPMPVTISMSKVLSSNSTKSDSTSQDTKEYIPRSPFEQRRRSCSSEKNTLSHSSPILRDKTVFREHKSTDTTELCPDPNYTDSNSQKIQLHQGIEYINALEQWNNFLFSQLYPTQLLNRNNFSPFLASSGQSIIKKGRQLGRLDYIRFDTSYGFFSSLSLNDISQSQNDKKKNNTNKKDIFFHFDDIYRAGMDPRMLLAMKKLHVIFSFEYQRYPDKCKKKNKKAIKIKIEGI